MNCTDKDQDTCNVEKMGCTGCAYYDYEDVIKELVQIENRLNQLSEENHLKLIVNTSDVFSIKTGKFTKVDINIYRELK